MFLWEETILFISVFQCFALSIQCIFIERIKLPFFLAADNTLSTVHGHCSIVFVHLKDLFFSPQNHRRLFYYVIFDTKNKMLL